MTITARHYDVILAPHITEKSTLMSEQNKYVFRVALDANKDEISSAIEAIYGATVKKVNTIVTKGKTKRFKGMIGRRSDMKKAIVTLAEDSKPIDIATGL